MERVVEKGNSYIATEVRSCRAGDASCLQLTREQVDRLKKLVDNKATSPAKRVEFGRRINILNAFNAEAKQV